MNILYLPLSYYPYKGTAGAAIVSHEIINRLSKKNNVFVVLPGESRSKFIIRNNLQVKMTFGKPESLTKIFPFSQVFEGIGDIKRFNPDVIISQYHPSNLISYAGRFLSKLEKCPLIVRSDDIYFVPFNRFSFISHFIHRLNYNVVSNSELFLVNSTEHKSIIERIYGRRDGVIINPNGVDINRFNPNINSNDLKHKLGLDGKRVILYAGTLAWFYGLNILPKVFSSVMRDMKEVVLVLVGLFGSSKEKRVLLHELHEYGVKENTLILPPISYENIHKYIAIGDICLGTLCSYPINIGTVPTKVPQYMACGKPTIVSKRGVTKDLIIHKKTGIIFDRNKPESLSEWIIRLLEDKNLCNKLGSSARNHVEKYYSWEKIISQLETSIFEVAY